MTVSKLIKEKLKTLSDKHLENMVKQRQGTSSDFREALIKEMATRCTVEYYKQNI
jgi:hypothetical protein